jgi:hypothetical protein
MVSDNATAAARGRCRDIDDDDDVPNNNNTSNPADHHILYISRKVGKANPKRDAVLFFGFLMLVFLISYKSGDVGYAANDNDNDNDNGNNKNNNNRRRHSSAINGWENRRKQLRSALLNPLVNIMNNYLSIHGINTSDDLHNCDFYLGSSSMISSTSTSTSDDDDDDDGSPSWGMFAGRNYLEGELILTDYNNLRLNHHHHHHTTQKDNKEEEEEAEDEISLQSTTPIIQPLSFLLQPHSILSNVRWDSIISSTLSKEKKKKKKKNTESSSSSSSSSSLIATRDIREGEELFLSWNDHLYYNSQQSSSSSSSSSSSYSSPIHNDDGNNSGGSYDYILADRLPTLEHYRRADDLIRDAVSVYLSSSSNDNNHNIDTQAINNNKNKNRRNQFSHGGRNNGRWNKNNAKAKKKKQQQNNMLIHQDIKSGLLLLQRAVARYDHPLVAKLLPTTEIALKKYHREYINNDRPLSLLSTPMSILGSLNNQTVVSLAVNAQCMSHIRWAKSSTSTPQVDKDITTTTTTTTATGEDNLNDSFSSSSSSQPDHQQIVSKANGFLHGDLLAIVPLLILQQHHKETTISCTEEKDDDDESCSATTSMVDACLPLREQYSTATSLSSSTMSLCPLFGIQEVTQDPKRANVEYKWSTTNDDSIEGQNKLRSFLLISSSSEEEHKEKQLQLKEILLKVRGGREGIWTSLYFEMEGNKIESQLSHSLQ